MSPAASFLPDDFLTGRWEGGACKATNPRFERVPWEKDGKSGVLIVAAFDFIDEAGDAHGQTYVAADASYAVIKESADEGADEAETGYALANVDPGRPFRLSPNQEFGIFLSNAYSSGMPREQLLSGDIRVFDGVDMVLNGIDKTDAKGNKTRYKLLVPTKVTVKGASTGAKTKTTAKAAAGGNGKAPADLATEIVLSVLEANGGEAKTKQLLDEAMKRLQGNPAKPAVTGLLSGQKGKEFLSASDAWSYDEDNKTVTAI